MIQLCGAICISAANGLPGPSRGWGIGRGPIVLAKQTIIYGFHDSFTFSRRKNLNKCVFRPGRALWVVENRIGFKIKRLDNYWKLWSGLCVSLHFLSLVISILNDKKLGPSSARDDHRSYTFAWEHLNTVYIIGVLVFPSLCSYARDLQGPARRAAAAGERRASTGQCAEEDWQKRPAQIKETCNKRDECSTLMDALIDSLLRHSTFFPKQHRVPPRAAGRVLLSDLQTRRTATRTFVNKNWAQQ